MQVLGRLLALSVIFLMASIAWLVLGGTMVNRADVQENSLEGEVAELWGRPMVQWAPTIDMTWEEPVQTKQTEWVNQVAVEKLITTKETRHRIEPVKSSNLTTSLSLDERRKGLVWFPLYDVAFRGDWTWTHQGTESGTVWVEFVLPDASGVYDEFHLRVNGQEVASNLDNGRIRTSVPVEPGERIAFSVNYLSRGRASWTYMPVQGAGEVTDFSLALTTDFPGIDYPPGTMSPSERVQTNEGWALNWKFERLITGKGMGMLMPTRVQPGELAASMSFSAPVSLGLFMAWIFVLGLLKKIEIHPMNHLMVAGAFFAFHLLFAYTADHLPVEGAFALAAVVSVGLVVSYLRLVAGPRFALIEAGLAQVVYLVGFSLAHFWDGFTGLTVTVLGIATLFALMQLTGRVDWGTVFSAKRAEVAPSLR